MSDGPESATAPAPVAAPAAPAIEKLASLFDELAGRHIAAHADDADRPFGITRAMLADFRHRKSVSLDELRQLAANPEEGKALAVRILRDRVWEPLMGDKLPPPVAAVLFDVALRRGVDRAGKTLQKAAAKATRAALKIDGALGRQTFLTLAQIDPDDLTERLLAHRGTFVWRLGDGKLLGHDVNLARAAIFAGKWALRATGIPLP